ncbi:hypothetical protein ACPB9I_05240 [Streptomyces cellulosae]
MTDQSLGFRTHPPVRRPCLTARSDLAEFQHAENDDGAFQLDDQVVTFPLPVPRGAGQHEIDPPAPPVLAQDGPARCGSIAAEQPAVLDEYLVKAATTDV